MGLKHRNIPGQKKLEIVLESLKVDNVAEFLSQKGYSRNPLLQREEQTGGEGAKVFNSSSKKNLEKERLKGQLDETKEDSTEGSQVTLIFTAFRQ